MAYTVVPAGDIVAGKPTKEKIFDQIRTNQEDFDTRLTSLSGTSKVDIFNIKFGGSVNQYTQAELASILPTYTAPIAATIVSFTITLLSTSTSGTLEMALDKSTDNGINWTPMLTTDLVLSGTTIGSTSAAPSFSSQTFNQNDLLRITINGAQVGQGDFSVSIYGEL